MQSEIEYAASLLHSADSGIAFTGAGISTPSGIPDFRSPGSGLWEHADPMEVASIWSFRTNPQRFFEWVRPLAAGLLEAEPNPAHFALAHLEKMGHLDAVITQNIDNLHQRADSRRVLEIHGHLRTATCLKCGHQEQIAGEIDTFVERGTIPRCDECGATVKPDVVLFGEILPMDVMAEATRAAEACDVMLVAGSSLEVTPAADLPASAVRAGARLIIVNRDPTPLDHKADVVVHGDVAEVLPRLADLCASEHTRDSNLSTSEG